MAYRTGEIENGLEHTAAAGLRDKDRNHERESKHWNGDKS